MNQIWPYGISTNNKKTIKNFILQESSITEAVEKQLQGGCHASSTPLMGKKSQISTHSEKTTPSGKFICLFIYLFIQ